MEYRTNKIKTDSQTQSTGQLLLPKGKREEKWAKGVNCIAVESKQTCSADHSAVYADANWLYAQNLHKFKENKRGGLLLVRQGPKYIVTGLYINSRMFQ